MKNPKKGYDCLAEVRKVRDELDALSPQEFLEWLSTAREEYYKSVGMKLEM